MINSSHTKAQLDIYAVNLTVSLDAESCLKILDNSAQEVLHLNTQVNRRMFMLSSPSNMVQAFF
jgi:hypothetical protein